MENPGFESQSQIAEPKKNKTGMIIAVVAVVLCCCCLVTLGLGYALWINGDQWFGTGALLNNLATL